MIYDKLTIKELEEHLKEKDKVFERHTNIKRFKTNHFSIEDFETLLIVQMGSYIPIYASGFGRSYYDDDDKDEYTSGVTVPEDLSKEEVLHICEKNPLFGNELNLQGKYLVCKANYSNELFELSNELIKAAIIKTNGKKETITYFLDNKEHKFTYNVKRTDSAFIHENYLSFFFYDCAGKLIQSMGPHNAIYG
jgi:hypothetical protein